MALAALIDLLRERGVTAYEGPAEPKPTDQVRLVLGPRPASGEPSEARPAPGPLTEDEVDEKLFRKLGIRGRKKKATP